jgi:hypothetical protein
MTLFIKQAITTQSSRHKVHRQKTAAAAASPCYVSEKFYRETTRPGHRSNCLLVILQLPFPLWRTPGVRLVALVRYGPRHACRERTAVCVRVRSQMSAMWSAWGLGVKRARLKNAIDFYLGDHVIDHCSHRAAEYGSTALRISWAGRWCLDRSARRQ